MAAVTSAENPAPTTEQLAQAIVDLSAGMKALDNSRLKRDTVVLLLHHITKVPKRDITYVLNALPVLARTFLKPKV